MKFNKFIYIFLTVLSGCLYSYSSSAFLFLLSGVSLCTLVLSDNFISGILTSILAFAGCGIMAKSPDPAVMFLLSGCLPGILLGTAYRKRLSLQYIVALPSCCFISGWAYMFFSYKAANGTNMFTDAVKLISENFDSSLSMVVELYGEQVDANTVELLSEAMASAFETFKHFVPSLIIIYSCILALLLVLFTGKTALRFGYGYGRSFGEIYAPGTVSLLIIVCFIAAFLFKENSGFFTNILVLFLTYYVLCGISLLDFYFRKLISSGLARGMIYLFAFLTGGLLLPQFLWSALMLAGMLDIMFDFRKLRPRFIDFDNEK